MAFKPNYSQERTHRTRAKEAKKQEKVRRLEEETAKRKASQQGESSTETSVKDTRTEN